MKSKCTFKQQKHYVWCWIRKLLSIFLYTDGKQRELLFVDVELWTGLWSFRQSDTLFGSELCQAFKKQVPRCSKWILKEKPVRVGQDRCDVFIVFCPSQHSGRGIQHKLCFVYCLPLVDQWKLHQSVQDGRKEKHNPASFALPHLQ